jgi:membrane-bound metal-dependent hydrolase YbcI (DUF457 family)
MRRITHLVLGAAVSVPIALDQPIALAVGCLAAGVIGGGTPDWIDFQSGMRRPFVPRHRGASHGLPVMIGTLVLLVISGLVVRDRGPDGLFQVDVFTGVQGRTLLMAFGLGWISHLASDSCTIGGIQPLLPFSRWRCWLLPRRLRSRSDGYLDKVVQLGALVTLGFALVVYAMNWLQR